MPESEEEEEDYDEELDELEEVENEDDEEEVIQGEKESAFDMRSTPALTPMSLRLSNIEPNKDKVSVISDKKV